MHDFRNAPGTFAAFFGLSKEVTSKTSESRTNVQGQPCHYVHHVMIIIMSSSCQYEQEQFPCESIVEKRDSLGTRDFTGENTLRRKTLCLFG